MCSSFLNRFPFLYRILPSLIIVAVMRAGLGYSGISSKQYFSSTFTDYTTSSAGWWSIDSLLVHVK